MKRTIVAAAALVALAACGGKAGGSTPEDVFEQAKKAGSAKDYRTFYACIDPDGADGMLLAMSVGAGFTCMDNKDAQKELEGITTKHGLKTDDKKPLGLGDKEKAKQAAKELFKDVKDRPALFSDLVTFMQKHGKDKNVLGDLDGTTLKDLKVDGTTAKAKQVLKDGKESQIAFVKRDERWYLTFD